MLLATRVTTRIVPREKQRKGYLHALGHFPLQHAHCSTLTSHLQQRDSNNKRFLGTKLHSSPQKTKEQARAAPQKQNTKKGQWLCQFFGI